ncbi:M23 family metallopeptidase [Sungkyunkwania multivorans]|uniref:M23 family metallopeptidase n=1 Tax=Sungkyunkwania multivorans TaxID=1173618 RepID=A0ABW3D294_9FLAO
MKPSFLRPFLFLLVMLPFLSCETEGVVAEQSIQNSVAITTLSDLPPSVQAKVNETMQTIQSNRLHTFGNVEPTQVNQVNKIDGSASYTMRLEKLNEGLYYDNLVVNEAADGSLTTNIIRYEPDAEWYKDKKLAMADYTSYTGRTTLFSTESDRTYVANLIDGALVNNPSGGTARSTECYVSDVQYVGLEQDGVFYVYEVNYTYTCYETGGGGGGGDPFNNDDETGGNGTGGNGDGDGVNDNINTLPVDEYGVPPCPGDPVSYPEIAPSSASGVEGGRYGCTRQANTSCNGENGKKYHGGLDVASPINSYAGSMFDGEIVNIVDDVDPNTYGNHGPCGNRVEIESTLADGTTIRIRYCHLNEVDSDLSVGQSVGQGHYIGTLGKTGNASGTEITPHVHVVVREQLPNGSWNRKNPELYMNTLFNTEGEPIIESEPCFNALGN